VTGPSNQWSVVPATVARTRVPGIVENDAVVMTKLCGVPSTASRAACKRLSIALSRPGGVIGKSVEHEALKSLAAMAAAVLRSSSRACWSAVGVTACSILAKGQR
jgi:hypothetical protein